MDFLVAQKISAHHADHLVNGETRCSPFTEWLPGFLWGQAKSNRYIKNHCIPYCSSFWRERFGKYWDHWGDGEQGGHMAGSVQPANAAATIFVALIRFSLLIFPYHIFGTVEKLKGLEWFFLQLFAATAWIDQILEPAGPNSDCDPEFCFATVCIEISLVIQITLGSIRRVEPSGDKRSLRHVAWNLWSFSTSSCSRQCLWCNDYWK